MVGGHDNVCALRGLTNQTVFETIIAVKASHVTTTT